MKTASFGLGLDFKCDNHDLGVGMNASAILTVEADYDGKSMFYRIGEPAGATVVWESPVSLKKGKTPQVALGKNGILEVHETEDKDHAGDLWYTGGRWQNPGITWSTNEKYDTGIWPSIALNDVNRVVEFHQAPNTNDLRLFYRLGQLTGTKISWVRSKGDFFATGARPRVSVNIAGVMAIVYETGNGDVQLCIAYIVSDIISLTSLMKLSHCWAPSVAFTDNFNGIVVAQSNNEFGPTLLQMTFSVENDKLSWASEVLEYSDNGEKPSVAAYGSHAIQVHEKSEERIGLFSTSLITERPRWMAAATQLQNTPIRNIAFPASHDAGMYTSGISDPGKTQSENLYYQAMDGIRWFDLRLTYDADFVIRIYHNFIPGPPLSEVLADLQRFFEQGGSELLFLNFSHFSFWSQGAYSQMVQQIETALGRWLFRSKPAGKESSRLSDLTLADYIATGAKALVTVDEDWAINDPHPGFWVYRTAVGPEATTPVKGDLRVYDYYANMTDYDSMKKDQFDKFRKYDGYCSDGSICDLFLLSWTLTPFTGVWYSSIEPNSRLGNDIRELENPNSHGLYLNQLYVDYAQYARPLDVSMYLNGIAPK
jgi:hypothetical protein